MKRFFLSALMALAVLVNAQATTWNLDNCTSDVTMRNGDVLIGEMDVSRGSFNKNLVIHFLKVLSDKLHG